MPERSFLDETAVERDPEVPGRYRASLSDRWCAPELPQGGVVTALALRAMAAELDDPGQAVRSVTTTFAAPVPSGPVTVDARVLRRGRSISQVVATVRADGADAGHTALAVFGAPRPGFTFTEAPFPDVPGVADSTPFDHRDPDRADPWSYWLSVEGRGAVGHGPHDTDWEAGPAVNAYWMRMDDPPRPDGDVLDPLMLVTFCDTMPGALRMRMGPDCPEFYCPSADLTVHILDEPSSEWILGYNRARFAGDGYASLEVELWDERRRLVAYGTQTAIFTFPAGAPPPERRRPPARSSR